MGGHTRCCSLLAAAGNALSGAWGGAVTPTGFAGYLPDPYKAANGDLYTISADEMMAYMRGAFGEPVKIIMRIPLTTLVLIAACSPVAIDSQGRESPAQIRRIIAQSICLAEAYPDSVIAKDAESVVAVFQGTLPNTVTASDVNAVRDLAGKEKPAAPTPVRNRNLAIARCVAFVDRPDVLKLLTAGAGRKN